VRRCKITTQRYEQRRYELTNIICGIIDVVMHHWCQGTTRCCNCRHSRCIHVGRRELCFLIYWEQVIGCCNGGSPIHIWWQLIQHVVYLIIHSDLHLHSVGVINLHAKILVLSASCFVQWSFLSKFILWTRYFLESQGYKVPLQVLFQFILLFWSTADIISLIFLVNLGSIVVPPFNPNGRAPV